MATDINISKASEWRVFIQQDGSSPANPYLYAGPFEIGGLTEDLGASTPIYAPSSDQRSTWEIVGTTRGAKALGTTDFTQLASRFLDDFLWGWRKTRCQWNVIIQNGDCGRPDDLDDFDVKLILRQVELTAFNPLGVLNPISGDNEANNQNTGSWSIRAFDAAKKLAWGEVLDTTIVAEVLDVAINDQPTCGECGTPSDGCKHVYYLAAANSGSPGLSSQVVVTKDGGSSGSSVDIPTLGGVSAKAMAVVGSYVVVISEAIDGHHWILVTDLEAGTPNWTEVTGGYVAGHSPRAIYSKSAAETLIGAQDGYIYKMTNPTSAVTVATDGGVTTENVNAIDGYGQTVVAGCANNKLLLSNDAGTSWSLVTGPNAGVAINTVSVINKRLWWVGYADGKGYFTLDAGTTWTQRVIASDLTVINHITFFDDIVGLATVQAGATGRTYITRDNGYTWHQTPYIKSLPTSERINKAVFCDYNTIFAGGRVSSGGDGIALKASSS